MITLIAGTNRPNSNTRKVTRILEEIYTGLHVRHQVLDLALLPPEIFSPAAYAQKPAGFQPFIDAVLASAGLVVVSPEYNGGFPGVLKYFIDMLKFPESFQERPVCFVGLAAGSYGGLRPIEQLQQIFSYRNAHLFPQRVFLPGIGDLLGDDGRLRDPEPHQRLQTQAAGFVRFIEKLKAVQLLASA